MLALEYDNLRCWNVWDFVREFTISREEVKAAVKNANAYAPSLSYDIDRLYGSGNEDIIKMLGYDNSSALKPDPTDIDRLFIISAEPAAAAESMPPDVETVYDTVGDTIPEAVDTTISAP